MKGLIWSKNISLSESKVYTNKYENFTYRIIELDNSAEKDLNPQQTTHYLRLKNIPDWYKEKIF